MPAILVLTGASGAGKSALCSALEAAQIPGLACVQCAAVYENLPAEVLADGEAAQDALLDYGVTEALALPEASLAVLDTQIRPHKAEALLKRRGIAFYRIVLVECEQGERESRLRGPRAQPELSSPRMECWAAYLRGQVDALGLDVIDTSAQPIADSLAQLRGLVDSLRARRQAHRPGRLAIVCGLPGAGKTTRAKALAAADPAAVRLCPDDWMEAAGIDLWDEAARAHLEASQGELARRLLSQGRFVVIEWGTWTRRERDTLRLGARALDARVELHFVDAPLDVLYERICRRGRESPPISRDDLRKWSELFERPGPEELALFDGGAPPVSQAG